MATTNFTSKHIADAHRLVHTVKTTTVILVTIIVSNCYAPLQTEECYGMSSMLTLPLAFDATATQGHPDLCPKTTDGHDKNYNIASRFNWKRRLKHEIQSRSPN